MSEENFNDSCLEVFSIEDLDSLTFLDDVCGHFEQVLHEISNAEKIGKFLEYSNKDYNIYTFIKETVKLFEVYNKETKKSTYHFISNQQLDASFLLALINRSEVLANRK